MTYTICVVWIDHVSIARPQVPEKDKLVHEKRVFPSEVSIHRDFLPRRKPDAQASYCQKAAIYLALYIFYTQTSPKHT